jgi:signal transduction histidine kinase
MIEPTPRALDLPGTLPASRVRSVLARACTPPAPCTSAAVVCLTGDVVETVARYGHGRLAFEEEDAARLAARGGSVLVVEEQDAAIVAAPVGEGLSVVVRLEHEATPERIERIEALAEAVALALEAEGLAGAAERLERDGTSAAGAAAYDLHDGPAQKLVWARNAVRDLQRGEGDASLETVHEVLHSAVADLQHVIARLLDPDSASVPPLELLLREELELASRRTGVETALSLPSAPLPELPPAVAETAYRLVQEAVSNAVTHAGATRVSVGIAWRRGRLSVSVDDDGVGFDVTAAEAREPAAGRGLGLRGMRDRVARAGGTLTVTSTPAQGTRVRAGLPVRLEPPADG